MDWNSCESASPGRHFAAERRMVAALLVKARAAPQAAALMCNLYSMTKSREAVTAFTRAMRDRTGNQPPLPAIFPGSARARGSHRDRRRARGAQHALGLPAAGLRQAPRHQCAQPLQRLLARLAGRSALPLHRAGHELRRVHGYHAQSGALVRAGRRAPAVRFRRHLAAVDGRARQGGGRTPAVRHPHHRGRTSSPRRSTPRRCR